MYLWVIIATFITAIAFMSTSLRPDMKHLFVEPQAQNVVTKIYTQHRAAMKYVHKNRTSGADGGIGYEAGEVTMNDLKGYAPYGFNATSGTATFTTAIYCLDRNSVGHSALPTDCQTGGGDPANPTPAVTNNCCAAKNRVVYLVTYGCVPYKWRDIKTGRPSAELLNAMKDTLGYVNGFGYVVNVEKDKPTTGGGVVHDKNGNEVAVDYDTLGTPYGIVGQGSRGYYSIPKYMSHNNLSGIAADRSFNHVCGSGINASAIDPDEDEGSDAYYKQCEYCLIYMSAL